MEIYNIKPSYYSTIMRLPVKTEEIPRIRGLIENELKGRRIDEKNIFHVCLALDEALTNAFEHGSSRVDNEVEVAYRIDDCEIELAITDSGGIVFNPEYFERLAMVKDWGAGGRGILLIKNYMDEVYFVFMPRKSTRVIMRKKLETC